MGTRPCEAESSGSSSRSSCPQIPRYFSPLGPNCGALSAVFVSQGEADWSFHGSVVAANQTAATSAHRLQNLIRYCGTGGSTTKAPTSESSSKVSTAGRQEESVEGVAADPNYRFIVTVKGPIPHEFSPEPTCHVFGSNLVANCPEYYGSAGSSGY